MGKKKAVEEKLHCKGAPSLYISDDFTEKKCFGKKRLEATSSAMLLLLLLLVMHAAADCESESVTHHTNTHTHTHTLAISGNSSRLLFCCTHGLALLTSLQSTGGNGMNHLASSVA
jgi:hypothetical protein